MRLREDWPAIRALLERAQRCGLHHAFGTVDETGAPHVTPIGSLMLHPREPRGRYFDIFNESLGENLDRDARVAVLAVDSRKWLWFRALVRGAFPTPPALRLYGTARARRKATPEEIARWTRAVRVLRPLRGYSMLWSRLDWVRDVEFDRVEPVRLGRMTERLYAGEDADADA